MTTSLAIPFVVEGDVVTATAHALEVAKVRHVLLTEPGELPWRTAFGTPLDTFRHRPLDHVHRELVRLRCRDALEQWLPATSVEVQAVDGDEGALTLRIARQGTSVEVVR